MVALQTTALFSHVQNASEESRSTEFHRKKKAVHGVAVRLDSSLVLPYRCTSEVECIEVYVHVKPFITQDYLGDSCGYVF